MACSVANPLSAEEKEAIRSQLDRIFAYPSFKNSVRCQNLLRFLVENSLQDEPEMLKERLVGVRVFGRPADYDNSHDNIVRNTTSEARKRLAQYYQDPEHEQEIHFEIPLGASYNMEFRQGEASPEEFLEPPVSIPDSAVPRRRPPGKFVWLLAIIVLAGIAGLCFWRYLRNGQSAEMFLVHGSSPHLGGASLDLFWDAILNTSGPVLLCVSGPQAEVKSPQVAAISPRSNLISVDSAAAAVNLSAFLGKTGKSFLLKAADSVTFDDLHNKSTILIGGSDNPWISRSTANLRYRFVMGKTPGEGWIEDATKPGSKVWVVTSTKASEMDNDYAIIGRYFDYGSRQYVIVISGLSNGAAAKAASEFLTDSGDMDRLVKSLPKDWPTKNIEAVIGMVRINGQLGLTRIEAAVAW